MFDYLSRFDRQEPVGTLIAPPEADGRFFYNDDLSGLRNFQGGRARLSKSFEFLLANRQAERPATLAAQSIPANTHLPGFSAENVSPLLNADVEPLLWLGNRAVVAAHQDPYENLACVVAGRRRFTLFPPEAVADLYIGPFEKTPGGPPISLVSFDDPDLDKHPRFARAMEVSQVVEARPWRRALHPVSVVAPRAVAGAGEPADQLLVGQRAGRTGSGHGRSSCTRF
ncbi:cupin-like domain-containing protein [Caulobacter segnis]